MPTLRTAARMLARATRGYPAVLGSGRWLRNSTSRGSATRYPVRDSDSARHRRALRARRNLPDPALLGCAYGRQSAESASAPCGTELRPGGVASRTSMCRARVDVVRRGGSRRRREAQRSEVAPRSGVGRALFEARRAEFARPPRTASITGDPARSVGRRRSSPVADDVDPRPRRPQPATRLRANADRQPSASGRFAGRKIE